MTDDDMQSDESMALLGYSELTGLGHGAERAGQLARPVTDSLRDLELLWASDVDGVEMALTFQARDRG